MNDDHYSSVSFPPTENESVDNMISDITYILVSI